MAGTASHDPACQFLVGSGVSEHTDIDPCLTAITNPAFVEPALAHRAVLLTSGETQPFQLQLTPRWGGVQVQLATVCALCRWVSPNGTLNRVSGTT